LPQYLQEMITAMDNRGIMAQRRDNGWCWENAYGVDNQRIRSQFYHGHFFLQKTKYFATNYEKEITSTKTREINYISTPYGTLAAYIKENNNAGQMHYLYKDHLGSITAINTAFERRSFDAWGRLRNPYDWSYDDIPDLTILDRGYTGHEHLESFGLINMNGRMYDPIIGRMLSPDPYVQGFAGTQGFNRYSYCVNNPLKYTDPDGEWVHVVVAAVIGGVMNVVTNLDAIDGDFLKGFVAFNVGAGQGALTAVCPVAGIIVGGAVTGATNNIIAQTGKDFSGMNNIDWNQVGVMAGVGVASSAVGYFAGQWAGKYGGGLVINGLKINSPVVQSTVTGAIGGAGGGYAGGYTGGYLLTGDPKLANKMGLQGMWTGLGTGATSGFAGGYLGAKEAGINPWTGKANNSITIGEGMDSRVKPISKDLSSGNIGDDWSSNIEAYQHGKPTQEGMDFNQRWIEFKMQNKSYIYDIGPKGNQPVSPYYNMELNTIMNYPNTYNVYPVQQPGLRILIIHKK